MHLVLKSSMLFISCVTPGEGRSLGDLQLP